MYNVDIYRTDDWVAVYFDDVLELEGHRISEVSLIKKTFEIAHRNPIDSLFVKTYYMDEEEAEKMGDFPKNRQVIDQKGIKVIT